MIQIFCEECGKGYRLDESKIKGKKARVKCRFCDNIMEVVKPESKRSTMPDFVTEVPAPSLVIGNKQMISTGNVSWLNSIQTKISTFLIIITTIVLLGFVVFNYYATKSKIDTELKNFTKITAERLAKYLEEPLWGLEKDQIDESLASEMLEKRIYGILVYDRDAKGVFLGKMRNDKNWNIVPAKTKIKGNLFNLRSEITRNKEVIGDVEVYVTAKFMEKELNRSVVNIGFTAIALYIAIFFAVFFALRKIIIHPIMELTDVAERMSMGDLNVKINIKSKNEVGILVKAIERMQESLRLALARLGRQR